MEEKDGKIFEDEIMSGSGRRVALGVRMEHFWGGGSTDRQAVAGESLEFVGEDW